MIRHLPRHILLSLVENMMLPLFLHPSPWHLATPTHPAVALRVDSASFRVLPPATLQAPRELPCYRPSCNPSICPYPSTCYSALQMFTHLAS